MSELQKRILTGIAMGTALIGSILLGSWWFIGMVFVLTALCINEFCQIFEGADKSPQTLTALFAGTFVFSSIVLYHFDKVYLNYMMLSPAIMLGVFMGELFRNKPNPMENIAYTLMAVFEMQTITVSPSTPS